MKCLVGAFLVPLLFAWVQAEATPDNEVDTNFGSGHVAMLRNISDSLDAAIADKRDQHKKIMEASVVQHGAVEKERERIHKELKVDRAQQFEEIMKIGDKQHQDFKNLLEQIMKNIENTDEYRLGQVHMELIKKISKTLADSVNEHAAHSKELQTLYNKHHAEMKNKKEAEAKEIMQDRNQQFEALNKKKTQQEDEIKKLLQAVMSKLDQPRNCYELYQKDVKLNGIYLIKPNGMNENHYVYCDMENHGNGWTVIQRRGDFGTPMELFIRDWQSYKNGFGKLTGEFWLGNDLIYHLTKDKPFQLYIEMKTFDNVTSHATFSVFQLGPESQYYALNIGGSGATGQKDSTFLNSKGQYFATNDAGNRRGCNTHQGGWWYNGCNYIGNLNGQRERRDRYSVTFDGTTPLAYTVMKIKPLPS